MLPRSLRRQKVSLSCTDISDKEWAKQWPYCLLCEYPVTPVDSCSDQSSAFRARYHRWRVCGSCHQRLDWHRRDGRPSRRKCLSDMAVRQGNYTRFVNHSCQPNCQFQKYTWLGVERIILVSKGVEAGREITVDYSDRYWQKLDKNCLCEEVYCRHSG